MAERGAVATGLRDWLRARGLDASVAVSDRATVGLSQETWFIRVDTGTGEREAVLRLPTLASGPQAILTQRAALEAVADVVPAPALLWYDDTSANPFECPFLVMERIRGQVPVGWRELDEPVRTEIAQEAVDVLASLHRTDPGAIASARGRSAERPSDLDWYRQRVERFAPIPAVLQGALWWLERRRPSPPEHQVLTHGDYRMGNMVIEGGHLQGVLDWEMASVGDPLADLAWCFIPVWEPSLVTESELVERYAERVCAPVDDERLHWHRVLGYVRLCYYALSGLHAFDRGRSNDFRLAALRLQLPVHLDRLAATLAGEPIT
ncbi:MAG TPA: phosphotransferase family protein [Solirubrobacteraceae bacterium]